MRKYLELFTNGFDETITDKVKVENKPYIGYSIEESKVVYTVVPKPVVSGPWVTFTAEEDNSSIGLEELSTNQILEYSTDTATWNTFDKTTNIPLNNGDKVYIRGVLNGDNTTSDYTQFKMGGKIAASGNCNALWNYEDLNAPLKARCGQYMFNNCTSLTSTPELPATILAKNCYSWMFARTSLKTAPELPATTLVDYCYSSMFRDCMSLTIAPELPTTTLADSCYYYMFAGCTALKTTPKILPAIILADSCYECMFYGCTRIVTAPILPATTLAYDCYQSMFSGCTSLNHITCLATDTSAEDCTYYWVYGVASTGTFIKHPDMTDWTTGKSGIPEGWTIVDSDI